MDLSDRDWHFATVLDDGLPIDSGFAANQDGAVPVSSPGGGEIHSSERVGGLERHFSDVQTFCNRVFAGGIAFSRKLDFAGESLAALGHDLDIAERFCSMSALSVTSRV